MNSFRALALMAVGLVMIALSSGDNPLQVMTKSGKVRGHTVSTTVGKDVDAFLGIPYGASTSGKNRFGPPKEMEPWDGIRDATKLPNPCYQIVDSKWRGTVFVSQQKEVEDCLFLNIWVPKPRPKKSAVMIWIHGGGFALGSIDLPLYSGSTIAAQENVIVVSVAYRLSGFGFLYLGHPQAPGNVGLMDQALGMEWVKNNIETFGGDPERITIFGQSAGGASVGLHLVAPSSLELYKNAILQSGSSASFWSARSPEDSLEQTLALAKNLGCPTNLDQRDEILHCLQNVDADKFASENIAMDHLLRMTFKPVIDGKFLPDCPSKLFSEGKFCKEKNIMIGYTREDGSFLLPMAAPDLELKEDTVFTEDVIKHIMSIGTHNIKKMDGLELNLAKHTYTDWESYPDDRVAARTQLIHFLTDRWFVCGALTTANMMSDKGNNVFFYRFDHIPENTIMPLKLPQWIGSSHGDELVFVFGHLLQNKNEDAKLSRQMMRYWANFARNSDPNDEYLPRWPKYNSQKKLMIQFTTEDFPVMKNDRTKECAFWDHVFPNIKNLPKDEL